MSDAPERHEEDRDHPSPRPEAETGAVPDAQRPPDDGAADRSADLPSMGGNGTGGSVVSTAVVQAATNAAEGSAVSDSSEAAGDEAGEANGEEALEITSEEAAELQSIVEALIFASDEPISTRFIRQIIDEVNKDRVENNRIRATTDGVKKAVSSINAAYADRAFHITPIAGGFVFATKAKYSVFVGKLAKEKARRKLSATAIESLAIIAYKQPITKSEIEFIRGVNADYIIKTLLEKNLITITGRASTPGRPLLYGTTDEFLKHFGLNEITDLPKPREIEELIGETELEVEKRLLAEQQELEFKDELSQKLEGGQKPAGSRAPLRQSTPRVQAHDAAAATPPAPDSGAVTGTPPTDGTQPSEGTAPQEDATPSVQTGAAGTSDAEPTTDGPASVIAEPGSAEPGIGPAEEAGISEQDERTTSEYEETAPGGEGILMDADDTVPVELVSDIDEDEADALTDMRTVEPESETVTEDEDESWSAAGTDTVNATIVDDAVTEIDMGEAQSVDEAVTETDTNDAPFVDAAVAEPELVEAQSVDEAVTETDTNDAPFVDAAEAEPELVEAQSVDEAVTETDTNDAPFVDDAVAEPEIVEAQSVDDAETAATHESDTFVIASAIEETIEDDPGAEAQALTESIEHGTEHTPEKGWSKWKTKIKTFFKKLFV